MITKMKFTILGVVLLSARFLSVLAAPVAPGQENCAEGEPLLGEIQPDVNLTVLPGLTIFPLSNISVTCDADRPRFPNSSAISSNQAPVNIKIFIGTFLVRECNDSFTCDYELQTYFPTLPRAISCTAANINNDCRFKVANITLVGDTTTTPSVSNTPTTTPTVESTTPPVTPPAPTTVTTTESDDDTDESDDESDDDSDDDDDSDSDSD